jgi:hypothetical protein
MKIANIRKKIWGENPGFKLKVEDNWSDDCNGKNETGKKIDII